MARRTPELKPVLVIGGFVVSVLSLIFGVNTLTNFDWSTWNLLELGSLLLWPAVFFFIGAAAVVLGMNYD